MDRFAICQAYAQLEADYNVGGWLRERPSNQRRRESIGCQLARMGYSNPYGWVDIDDDGSEPDPFEDEVREVYLCAVLRLDLPIDADRMRLLRRFFTADFLAQYQQTAGTDHKQGHS
jgi:hypothetical protein